ncbi:hypothetical protein HDU77_010740 [Chytriomyces hyalinus]|nr:hypothetical protein HDU77_010740 [Chytriomyces hyalinus]
MASLIPAVSLAPIETNTGFFDLCAACTTPSSSSLAPCQAEQTRVTALCNQPATAFTNPLLVVPLANVSVQVAFSASSPRIAFFLKGPNFTAPLPLPDYDPNPQFGPFFPQDKGRSPTLIHLRLPNDTQLAYGDGYSIIFKAYKTSSSTSDFQQLTFRNITIDPETAGWAKLLRAANTTLPGGSGTGNGGKDNASPAQTIWVVVVSLLAGLAVVFTLSSFFYRRWRNSRVQPKVDQGQQQMAGESEQQVLHSYYQSMGRGSPANSDDASQAHDLYRPESQEDVIFVFTPSKKEKREKGDLSIGDGRSSLNPTLASAMKGRRDVAFDSDSEGKVYPTSSRRVLFRETVDMAVVDLSEPPAAAAEDGMFDGSSSEEFSPMDDDEQDSSHLRFNDGGIERDVKAILQGKQH